MCVFSIKCSLKWHQYQFKYLTNCHSFHYFRKSVVEIVPWGWRQYIPVKCNTYKSYGVIIQKTTTCILWIRKAQMCALTIKLSSITGAPNMTVTEQKQSTKIWHSMLMADGVHPAQRHFIWQHISSFLPTAQTQQQETSLKRQSDFTAGKSS